MSAPPTEPCPTANPQNHEQIHSRGFKGTLFRDGLLIAATGNQNNPVGTLPKLILYIPPSQKVSSLSIIPVHAFRMLLYLCFLKNCVALFCSVFNYI